MLTQEALSPASLEREPEPTAEMNQLANVLAFHEQGAEALQPIYHFNALATSRLLRSGGTVLDLGSGSGQYLAYLARLRPDIQIIGLELSQTMISVGQRFLSQNELSDRVELRVGDMTSFASQLFDDIDVVSVVFSLHHLPDWANLIRCLGEIAYLRERCKCAVWIFDHTRPRHPKTPELFPQIFTPDAAPEFRTDSTNSLRASFSFPDLSGALDNSAIGHMNHQCSRFLRLYQTHWIRSQRIPAENGLPLAQLVRPIELSQEVKTQFNGIRMLLPRIPLDIQEHDHGQRSLPPF
jgi:SAM-dependent methyltransferase